MHIPIEILVATSQKLYDAAKAAARSATPSTNVVTTINQEEEGIYYIKKKLPNRKMNPSWCYFHQTYGKAAKKCRPPCKFPKN